MQRASLGDELKYSMSTKLDESTAMLLNVIRIVHLNAFQTEKTSFTGMRTWIIKMRVKTTGRQTMNPI
jgi:hypothetical protein